jgi:hypothetical protein
MAVKFVMADHALLPQFPMAILNSLLMSFLPATFLRNCQLTMAPPLSFCGRGLLVRRNGLTSLFGTE